MASSKERWLNHLTLDLAIRQRPTEKVSLITVLNILENHGSFGKQDFALDDRRFITQLLSIDSSSYSGFTVLLFLAIDRERAAAVYGDVNTLSLRTAMKSENEGVATTAHLIVRHQQNPAPSQHYCILEDVEGLSRSRVVRYLSYLFEKFIIVPEEVGPGEVINRKTTLHHDIVLDTPVSEQLNSAHLVAVDVFRRSRSSTIDKRVGFYERKRLIEYKPTSKYIGEAARQIVFNVLKLTEMREYPEARIRVEEPDGNERTVGVDRTKEDALLNAFQLRTIVSNLTPALEDASDTLVHHLIRAILPHFPPL